MFSIKIQVQARDDFLYHLIQHRPLGGCCVMETNKCLLLGAICYEAEANCHLFFSVQKDLRSRDRFQVHCISCVSWYNVYLNFWAD